MGCSHSKRVKKMLGPKNNIEERIEKKLLPILEITHDLNVNKKYSFMIQLIPESYVNRGIRRTNEFICLVTETELKKRIDEFWGFITRHKNRGMQNNMGNNKIGMLL